MTHQCKAAPTRPHALAGVTAAGTLINAGVRLSGPTETILGQREAEKRGVLQSHYLFGKLEPTLIDRLASCIVEKSVRRGTIIFAKDDPGSSLFGIRKGTAKMTMPSADGHEVVVNLVTKGDIFGEIALLDGGARTADAVAITDCQMFVIERRDFLLWCEKNRRSHSSSSRSCAGVCDRPLSKSKALCSITFPAGLRRPCYVCPAAVAVALHANKGRRHAEGSWQHYWHIAGEHQPTIAPLGREQMDPS